MDDISELLLTSRASPRISIGDPVLPLTIRSVAPKPGQAMFLSVPLAGSPTSLPVGLKDIFTPLSTGKINLNTASSAALQMIPGIDQSMADHIIQMRSEAPIGQHGAQDLINIGLSPAATQALSQYCDVRSSTFEVDIDVAVGLSKRHYIAIIRRNGPRDVQILNFCWE